MGKENHYNVYCVVEESIKTLVVPTVAKITIFFYLLVIKLYQNPFFLLAQSFERKSCLSYRKFKLKVGVLFSTLRRVSCFLRQKSS